MSCRTAPKRDRKLPAAIDLNSVRAVEFFSGIGAFAQAAASCNIAVVAAFDQSQPANLTYHHNYGLEPIARNLDTVGCNQIPEAEIWWMSPPCTPFSVRGKRKDQDDPRAVSFLNLIDRIAQCLPSVVMIENVSGFVGSFVHQHLTAVLSDCAYQFAEWDLCPTEFGVPMRRLRHFVVAVRNGWKLGEMKPAPTASYALTQYLDAEPDSCLIVDDQTMRRYGHGFDIVDGARADAYLTCFTSGYWRCRKASGSLLALPNGGARRFAPEEILRLLGFRCDFSFPAAIDLPARWRLLGNSVDVRAVEFLLGLLELPDG